MPYPAKTNGLVGTVVGKQPLICGGYYAGNKCFALGLEDGESVWEEVCTMDEYRYQVSASEEGTVTVDTKEGINSRKPSVSQLGIN